jgi:hypothetical protein
MGCFSLKVSSANFSASSMDYINLLALPYGSSLNAEEVASMKTHVTNVDVVK